MQRYVLRNLSCPSCADKLEKALCAMPSVKEAKINFNTGILSINTNDNSNSLDSIKETIKQIEPQVDINTEDIVLNSTGNIGYTRNIYRILLLLLAFIVAISLLHIESLKISIDSMLGNEISKFISYAMLACLYVIAGFNVYKSVLNNLRHKIFFDEHCLMLVATLAALAIGEISEAVAVMIFFNIGELLESIAIQKSKDSLQHSIDIMPNISHKQQRDYHTQTIGYIDIHPKDLQIGDIALVKVGERIPSDGVVISGHSHIDVMSLNGESDPMPVKVGDTLLAGALNLSQAIEITITSRFQDSQVAKIKDIVEHAQDNKPKTQRLITAFSQIYMPIMFCVALFVAFVIPIFVGNLHEWIYRGLVVLMVSCPCALMLSVPLGYFGALGIASRHGIIIKGSVFLEILADLGAICFDKTGTLTKGEFCIKDINTTKDFSKEDLLTLAINAQRYSKHPIAVAIMSYKQDNIPTLEILEHEEKHGKGVVAICNMDNKACRILMGNESLMQEYNISVDSEDSNAIFVAKDHILVGNIIMQDSIKAEAKDTILALEELGVKPLAILSGDKEKNVAYVANALGIKKFFHSLLPTQKAEALKDLKATDEKIAFVGDGINDSIALANADIGISIHATHSSSDINKESADIILTNQNLSSLTKAINIAKKARFITWQNIAFVLCVKIALLILGICGIANMWLAVFGDVGVALLALANASRVIRT